MVSGGVPISERVLNEYSTKWQMSLNPSEFRQSYEVACGEYPNEYQVADARFAQSLRIFLEKRAKITQAVYADYKRYVRGSSGCPKGSPTNVLREQLLRRYEMIIHGDPVKRLWKQSGVADERKENLFPQETPEEDALLIDATGYYARVMQDELNTGSLDHDRLMAIEVESRNYWAMKQIVEIKNTDLKKMVADLITWVPVSQSEQQSQRGGQPQFPFQFAEVVQAVVNVDEKFDTMRRRSKQGSGTSETQISALEKKVISEFQSLFATLVTREEGKPKLPPLFAALAAALINFDQNEWEQYLAQQHSSLDGSLSDFARIAEHDGTGEAFPFSLLVLLKRGGKDIFDKVANLEATPLKGNKTIKAWVHMVAYLAAHEKLSDRAIREIVEGTLNIIESSVRSIQDDAKGYGRSQELYKKTAIASMEDHVLHYSAALLKEQLDGVVSFYDYVDAKGGSKGEGEPNGSPGVPVAGTPQSAPPVESDGMSGLEDDTAAPITMEFERVGDRVPEKLPSHAERVAANSRSGALEVHAALQSASQVAGASATRAAIFNAFGGRPLTPVKP